MNKGRDYYRAEQAWAKNARNRRRYPQLVDVHVAAIPGKRKPEFVVLGNRHYRRDNIKNKIYTVPHAFDAEGKPVTIPYQTCTLVGVTVEPAPTVEFDTAGQ